MKRLLICFGGLAILVIGIVLILSLIRGVDPKILLVVSLQALGNFFLFICELVIVYALLGYALYRIASERKIRKDIAALLIPVRVMRLSSLPGFRFPYSCYDTDCKGVLVSTTICEPHSLAGPDGKVLFPSSDNRCRIGIGPLAQYRQRFGGVDRLFCTDCGTEYDWRGVRPADHPLNLYKILPQ